MAGASGIVEYQLNKVYRSLPSGLRKLFLDIVPLLYINYWHL